MRNGIKIQQSNMTGIIYIDRLLNYVARAVTLTLCSKDLCQENHKKPWEYLSSLQYWIYFDGVSGVAGNVPASEWRDLRVQWAIIWSQVEQFEWKLICSIYWKLKLTRVVPLRTGYFINLLSVKFKLVLI